MNRTVAIALLILLFAFQGFVLYIVSAVNPTTLVGQRVAGITLGADMFLFAGFLIIYHKNFSKPVYAQEQESEEEYQTES